MSDDQGSHPTEATQRELYQAQLNSTYTIGPHGVEYPQADYERWKRENEGDSNHDNLTKEYYDSLMRAMETHPAIRQQRANDMMGGRRFFMGLWGARDPKLVESTKGLADQCRDGEFCVCRSAV